MMEYAKVILPKVCFWENLFKKELLKCVGWTGADEMNELRIWCYNTFGEIHPDILSEAFAHISCNKRDYMEYSYPINAQKKLVKRKLAVEVA